MQRLIFLVFLVFLGWIIYLLGPVLVPFLLASAVAYAGSPLVTALERHRIGRTLGSTLVFLLAIVAIAGAVMALLPTVQKQAVVLLDYLRAYAGLLQDRIIPQISRTTGIPLDSRSLTGYATSNASRLATWLGSGLHAALVSGSGVLSGLLNILLIPILGFYLLRDWPRLLSRIQEMIPPRHLPLAVRLARDSDQMLMAFLRGQILVMLALGTTYATGLALVGLKTALLVGLLSGLLSFVPYMGFAGGILVASLAMYIQKGTFIPVLEVWTVYAAGQAMESFLFTPLLVGDRIGLHPVLVIFAVLSGGQLFGFAGLLLALPVTAVGSALLRHAHRWYIASSHYLGEPVQTTDRGTH